MREPSRVSNNVLIWLMHFAGICHRHPNPVQKRAAPCGEALQRQAQRSGRLQFATRLKEVVELALSPCKPKLPRRPSTLPPRISVCPRALSSTRERSFSRVSSCFVFRVGGTWGEEEDSSIVWQGVPQTNGGSGSSHSNASSGSNHGGHGGNSNNSWNSSSPGQAPHQYQRQQPQYEVHSSSAESGHAPLWKQPPPQSLPPQHHNNNQSHHLHNPQQSSVRSVDEQAPPPPRQNSNAQWGSQGSSASSSWGEPGTTESSTASAVNPRRLHIGSSRTLGTTNHESRLSVAEPIKGSDNGTSLWGGGSGGGSDRRQPPAPSAVVQAVMPPKSADASSFGNWSPPVKNQAHHSQGWDEEERLKNGGLDKGSRGSSLDDGTAVW